MKRLRSTSGFTLVELIVVLVILAVLAAILVPTLTGYITQAQNQKDYDTAAELKQAAQAAVIKQHQQHPTWTYEYLNSINSHDGSNPRWGKGLTIDGEREGDYVLQLAGVDASDIDWFWFNVDNTGAITPIVQRYWFQNPGYPGQQVQANNFFPTAVSIKGEVYYMQDDGSWTAAELNGNGTFTADNLSQYNYRTKTTSKMSNSQSFKTSGWW